MRLRLGVALLFVAALAAAQVRESVTVNLIEVPVTVVDSGGNPVRGLTKANFELFDQGKKREITSFDVIDFAVRDAVSAIAPMNPAARRSFLLLFDLGYSSPNSLTRAQDAARRFVKESVQPRDLVGVGTIDVDRGFHLLAAFTTDRQLVASAIGNPLSFRGSDPLQIANQRSTFLAEEEPLAEAPDRTAPGGARDSGGDEGASAADFQKDAREHAQIVAESMKRAGATAVRKRIEKQVDALGDLAKTLSIVPGRKQIIFLSEGFDASFLQGRDARAGNEQKGENEDVLKGAVWAVDSDARYGSTSGLTTLDRMARYFRTSDVVLHAIDIKGVRVQNAVAEGAVINSNAGLFTLARPTGGLVFENSNDLKDNFARMLRAQEVVYVLGFQTSATKPGTLHALKVKVTGANVAQVSYRAGYVESGGEAVSDAEIIVNDLPKRDIRVDAMAAAFPIDDTRAQVPLVLEINGEDLLKTAKDGNAIAEVYVYAFDGDGVVRDRLYEKMRLDLAKAGDRLRATGAKFMTMLTLPPGDYAVKSLVRVPDSDRRGFTRTAVHVPRPGEIVATSFLIDEQPPQWVMVRGTSLDPTRYPFRMGGQSFVPSAAPRVRSGEKRRLALFVNGAPVEELKVEFSGSQPQLLGEGEADGMAKLLYAYEAGTQAPGPAALRIVVHRTGMSDLQTTLPLVVQ